MSSQAERELGYHIIKYLESQTDESSDANKPSVLELSQSLAKLFDVNTKSVDDFLSLEYYHSDISQILAAGVASLEAGHFPSDLLEAQNNPKFEPFANIIKSRKYFDGSTEGTLEHLRRQSRVLSKFREKYPKTDLSIEDPQHPLRKSLAASTITAEVTTPAPAPVTVTATATVVVEANIPPPPPSPEVVKQAVAVPPSPPAPAPAPTPAPAEPAANKKKKKGKK